MAAKIGLGCGQVEQDPVPVQDELGGHHHRHHPSGAGGDEVAEGMLGEERPPLPFTETAVGWGDVHGILLDRWGNGQPGSREYCDHRRAQGRPPDRTGTPTESAAADTAPVPIGPAVPCGHLRSLRTRHPGRNQSMIKLTCLLKRKEGMTPAEFQAYWRQNHEP